MEKLHKRKKKDTETWGTKPNSCLATNNYTPTKDTTKKNENLGVDTHYKKI